MVTDAWRLDGAGRCARCLLELDCDDLCGTARTEALRRAGHTGRTLDGGTVLRALGEHLRALQAETLSGRPEL